MPWTWNGSKHPLVFCNTGNLSTQDFLNSSYRMQAYIHLNTNVQCTPSLKMSVQNRSKYRSNRLKSDRWIRYVINVSFAETIIICKILYTKKNKTTFVSLLAKEKIFANSLFNSGLRNIFECMRLRLTVFIF